MKSLLIGRWGKLIRWLCGIHKSKLEFRERNLEIYIDGEKIASADSEWRFITLVDRGQADIDELYLRSIDALAPIKGD